MLWRSRELHNHRYLGSGACAHACVQVYVPNGGLANMCVCPSAHVGWTGLDQSVLNHSCKPPTRANARIECAPMLAKFNSHDRQRAPRPTWRAIACVRMRSTRPDVCKDLGLCMSPIATCTTPSLRVGVRSHAFERARRRANAFARVRTRALVRYVCYFI